jgi:hypothetical protein
LFIQCASHCLRGCELQGGTNTNKTNHKKKGYIMAITAEVKCINKTDRYNAHERIKAIGGVNSDGRRWKMTQEEAIAGIESGTYKFYVSVAGRSVWIVVAVSSHGNKYLKTEADGEQPNNLLSLPECP